MDRHLLKSILGSYKKRFYGKEITSNNLYEKLDDIENEDYMKGLIIEHTLITTLQKNTLNKFSNLLHLSITNSGITSLPETFI